MSKRKRADETADDKAVIVADGERYQELANGAIYDHAVKRIVANPPGGPTTGIKSQSQAVELANLRWQKAAAASRRALRDVSTKPNALIAWGDLVGDQYLLGRKTDKGRASTEAARFVGQATGFLASGRQSADPPARGARLEISPELGLAIAEMLADRQRESERDEACPEERRDG